MRGGRCLFSSCALPLLPPRYQLAATRILKGWRSPTLGPTRFVASDFRILHFRRRCYIAISSKQSSMSPLFPSQSVYFFPFPFFCCFFGASFLTSFFSSATGPPCVSPSALFFPFLPLGL